jgi:hypothetical protein
MRAVPVRSIEEEYRYIQFHPVPCPCGSERRKAGPHGVTIRPIAAMLLARVLGAWILQFLPFLRLHDEIDVACPACDARATYVFDVAKIPHVEHGFRRGRFRYHPRKLVMQHMENVVEFHRRHEGTSLGDLEL